MTNQEFQIRLRDMQTKQRQEYDAFVASARADHEREMLTMRSAYQNSAPVQQSAAQPQYAQQPVQAPVTPAPTDAAAPVVQPATPEMSPLLQQMVVFGDIKGLLTKILERLPAPAAPVQEEKTEQKSEVKEVVKPVKSTK